MREPIDIPIHRLLQHRAWVRRLARTLVRDEARADDLEQQTWMAALKRPPHGDTPKAWLGQVMRNLAARMRRGEGRVAKREHGAARPEALPATGDVVAEAELHKRVVQAVLELEPPYRESVLHRHFEGLPPREIAARMGVSVETVRSRVRRGLEHVRARLDREHGGDGHTWRLALLPLAAGPGGGLAGSTVQGATGTGGALGTGALLMAAKSKFTFAALALLLLGGGLWLALRDTVPDGAPDDPPPAVETAKNEADAAKLKTRGQAQPAADETATAEGEPKPPALAAGEAAVRVVRMVEGRERAVQGAIVRLATPKGVLLDYEVDEVGRVIWPATWHGVPSTLWVLDVTSSAMVRRAYTPMPGETVIRMPKRVDVLLAFEDEQGRRLTTAEVKKRYEAAGVTPVVQIVSADALAARERARMLENMLGLSRGLALRTKLLFKDGRAVVGLTPSTGTWRLLLERPGAAPDLSDSFTARVGEPIKVTMRIPTDPGSVRIRAVAKDTGAPIPGAIVTPYFEIGDDAAFFGGTPRTTDERGEVALPTFDKRDRPYQRPPTWWITAPGRATAVDSAVFATTKPRDVAEVHVWRTGFLEGRAYLRTGEPAVGRTVIAGTKGRVIRTQVGVDGHYRLDGISVARSRTCRVMFVEDLEAASLGMASVRIEPGMGAYHDFGEARLPSEVASISGRFTMAGRPLAGVFLVAAQTKDRTKAATGETNAEGRFRLAGLTPGTYEFRFLLGDLRVSDDFGGRTREPLAIKAGDALTYNLDFPTGVLEVVVLDAESGKPVGGSLATARPVDRTHGEDRFEGIRLKVGSGEHANNKDGVVHLRALPLNTALEVRAGAPGYKFVVRKEVRAGSSDKPPRIEIKLTKKR